MYIKMYGEFDKHYGLCKYDVPDDDARYAIAHEKTKYYLKDEPKDKVKEKNIRTAFKWILDEIDYEPSENDEEWIKDYYDTQAMKDDLEILDVIEQDED